MTGQPDISPGLRRQLTDLRDTINTLLGDPLVRPGLTAAVPLPGGGDPGRALPADLDAAQASPANPYGSFDRGRYDAASPAEAGRCGAQRTVLGTLGTYSCTRPAGHDGDHKVMDGVEECARWPQEEPGFCPSYWDNPEGRMYCAGKPGHTGNHATAEGIEWGGDWKTAEPGSKDGAR